MKIKFKGAVDSVKDLEQALRASFMDCFDICEGDGAADCAACQHIEITIEIRKVGRTKRLRARGKS